MIMPFDEGRRRRRRTMSFSDK
jgi:hypothetical protein